VHPPGDFSVVGPYLAPSVARRRFRDGCRQLHIDIERRLPERPETDPLFLATPAKRQRRRLTWPERLDRYALPEGATLKVTITAKPTLLLALGLPPPAQARA